MLNSEANGTLGAQGRHTGCRGPRLTQGRKTPLLSASAAGPHWESPGSPPASGMLTQDQEAWTPGTGPGCGLDTRGRNQAVGGQCRSRVGRRWGGPRPGSLASGSSKPVPEAWPGPLPQAAPSRCCWRPRLPQVLSARQAPLVGGGM